MKVNFLKAFNGDAIHLRFQEGELTRNILIDGGVKRTYGGKNKKRKYEYGSLHKKVNSIRDNGEKIDLLVLTHVDDDHIAGILEWFKRDSEAYKLVDKVWFNSGRLIKEMFEKDKNTDYNNDLKFGVLETINTSIKQGVKFEDYIEEKGIWERKLFIAGQEFDYLGLNFKILSPSKEKLMSLLTKWEDEQPILETAIHKTDYSLSLKEHINQDTFFNEDSSVHNGSSIAFIIKHGSKELLFLGDSHPTVIINSLNHFNFNKTNPLKTELTKLSHHGSANNTTKELLDIIEAKEFIISTNGNRHSHPHKKLISRVINAKREANISFNYPELIDEIFSDEDAENFPEANWY
jgi:beta-lactamase superfamily II metal-dependent hydrolase